MKRRTNLNVMPRMAKSVTLTPQQFDVAWKALCFVVRWQEDAIKGTLPPAGDPNQDQLNTGRADGKLSSPNEAALVPNAAPCLRRSTAGKRRHHHRPRGLGQRRSLKIAKPSHSSPPSSAGCFTSPIQRRQSCSRSNLVLAVSSLAGRTGHSCRVFACSSDS